ncbi:MAG: sugar phosphate isomerase/epimerase family protein [Planctomycetota bacterium]
MLQLGFTTAILPDLSFEEVVRHAAEIGFDCIEVMCWPPGKSKRRYAGITHIDTSAFNDDDASRVKSICEEHGVSISALGYYPNVLTPDGEESAATIAHLKTVIDATSKLGLSTTTTFIGRDWTKNVDDNWPRLLEVWRPLVAHAESLGVRIGIENCPMFFTNDEWPSGKNIAHSPAIWDRLFDDLGPTVGLNYDPSHMIFQHMNEITPITDYADRLYHMHAKDVRLDKRALDRVGILANPNDYHTPKLPGMGDVRWGEFFSALTDTGYRGPVCVEVEDRAYEGSLEDRLSALRQSYNFLKQFIA